jgi:hypothetical protein
VDDLGRPARLKAFLLRHGYRYQGKSNWTQAHMRYLREVAFPHPAMEAILKKLPDGDQRRQRAGRTQRTTHHLTKRKKSYV